MDGLRFLQFSESFMFSLPPPIHHIMSEYLKLLDEFDWSNLEQLLAIVLVNFYLKSRTISCSFEDKRT